MSRLSDWTLVSLVRLWRRQLSAPTRAEAGASSSGSFEDYARWQLSSSRHLLSLFPSFDVRGRSVLEIGCGTGGRALYLAEAGASRVVGIDINAGEIELARQLSRSIRPDLAPVVEFHSCKENIVETKLGQFDVVVMIDSLEHVLSPALALRIAHAYTKTGGRFFFGTQGWYHHRGSHTNLLPFVNLFFSDETILNAIRWDVSRSDYTPTRFDSDPPSDRWRGLYDLRDRPGEYLNKITIRQMRALLRHCPFRERRLVIIGFSRPRPFSTLVNPLRHVPLLQEVLHSYVVGVCQA